LCGNLHIFIINQVFDLHRQIEKIILHRTILETACKKLELWEVYFEVNILDQEKYIPEKIKKCGL
jgi:hypothetical protein